MPHLKAKALAKRLAWTTDDLPNDVAAGDVLWLDDGLLTLTVERLKEVRYYKGRNSHVLKVTKVSINAAEACLPER